MAKDDDEEKLPRKVTDIEAARDNIEAAVMAFHEQWAVAPEFMIGVEVMDQRQLRDAMGLRASMDIGDPWPKAEMLLLKLGYKWHLQGGTRVMYVIERDGFVDADWSQAEEIKDEQKE